MDMHDRKYSLGRKEAVLLHHSCSYCCSSGLRQELLCLLIYPPEVTTDAHLQREPVQKLVLWCRAHLSQQLCAPFSKSRWELLGTVN